MVRILVIDDCHLLVSALQRVLKNAGYAVLGTSSSREGIELLQRERVHLVITDLHMPELDGLGATALLRTRDTARSVPIIIVTATGGAKEWAHLSALGADGFVVKPINLDDLVSTIRRSVRERSSRAPFGPRVPRRRAVSSS